MTTDEDEPSLPFGKALRAKRLERSFTLRKFAELVGVSPTYLSQVEQCNVMPPTADRVERMAELLGENSDEWTALAGRVPTDLAEIIQESPAELAALLRAARGMSSTQLLDLLNAAEQIKSKR
ncbi:MAG: helix-turn-helix transcriptional regulator [Candidatus Paceibacterota bacterium]